MRKRIDVKSHSYPEQGNANKAGRERRETFIAQEISNNKGTDSHRPPGQKGLQNKTNNNCGKQVYTKFHGADFKVMVDKTDFIFEDCDSNWNSKYFPCAHALSRLL